MQAGRALVCEITTDKARIKARWGGTAAHRGLKHLARRMWLDLHVNPTQLPCTSWNNKYYNMLIKADITEHEDGLSQLRSTILHPYWRQRRQPRACCCGVV